MVFTSLRNLHDAGADTQRVSPFSSPFGYRAASASTSPHFNFRKVKKESPKSQPHTRTSTKQRKNSYQKFSSRQASVSSPGVAIFRSQSARAGAFVQLEPNHVAERVAVDQRSLMKFSSACSEPFAAPEVFEEGVIVEEKTVTNDTERAGSNAVVHKRTKSEPPMSQLVDDEHYDATRGKRPTVVGDADVRSQHVRRGDEPRTQALSEPLWNLLGFWRVYEPERGDGLRFASHMAIASQFVSLLVDLPFIILGAFVALSFRSNSMRSKMPRSVLPS